MTDSRGLLARLLGGPSVLDDIDPLRPDLDRAYKVLSAKLSGYNDIWNYYDGDQPLMYTASRMRDLFAKLDMATFVENWCAIVVDSANDRIALSGVATKNDTIDTLINDAFEELEIGIEASDAHEAAIVIGESYIIGWEDENGKPEIFYNDPRLVHLFYDSSNPKKKDYGAKWWVDNDGHVRMTLYYDDRLEYYRSNKKAKAVSSSRAFEVYSPEGEGGEVATHEYGEVPVFHFRLERRKTKGDLTNVIPLQNGINKLLTDMMVAAEYGAFKQRWIISNADTDNLKNAPNEIWEIPAGDGQGQATQVGEFNPTDLGNYIQSMDHMASTVAIISRTPKHFLFQQGGDPSGEALIAMEAPLNKRCDDHITKFIPVWKEIVQFMLGIMNQEVEKNDIEIQFDKPETIQPKTEAEVRNLGRTAGIPLVTLLKDEGKSDAWIEQMQKDKEEETEANQASLGVALMGSIRNANQPAEGGPPGTEEEPTEE